MKRMIFPPDGKVALVSDAVAATLCKFAGYRLADSPASEPAPAARSARKPRAAKKPAEARV